MRIKDLMEDKLISQVFHTSESFLLEEAKNENVDAMLLLAIYYNYSYHRDYKKAFEWCQKAADAGDADAYYYLGEFYFDDHDPRKALEWYQKAVDMGSAKAMFEMGRFYYKGFLVPKDEEKAMALFEQAAQLGHGEACLWLSDREKDEKNLEKALQYAEKAYWNCLGEQW